MSRSQLDLAAKRALDVAMSAAGLWSLAPLMAGIAVAVKATSDGPVFFGHERVGRDGQRFVVWKFRTMRPDAPSSGSSVTAKGDPRITAIGRLLRKTKLDELPQLFNVLRGDMSFVGPRPEVREYVELFSDEYAHILTIRPGITDEASLEFRDEEAVLAAAPDPMQHYVDEVLPRKLALASEYVDNGSFTGDLFIIARTVVEVVRP